MLEKTCQGGKNQKIQTHLFFMKEKKILRFNNSIAELPFY